MRICLHDECFEPTKSVFCQVRTGHHHPTMGLAQLETSIERWEGLRSVFPQATVAPVLERRRSAQAILSVILDQDNGAR